MPARAKRAKAPAKPAEKGRKLGSRPAFWVAIAILVAAIGSFLWLAVPEPRQEDIVVSELEPGLITKVESLYNDIYVYKQNDENLVLSFGAARLRYVSLSSTERQLISRSLHAVDRRARLRPTDAAIIGPGGGRPPVHPQISARSEIHRRELDPEVPASDTFFFRSGPRRISTSS
jgi:hypothetical protein